jgi:hypothetical protein
MRETGVAESLPWKRPLMSSGASWVGNTFSPIMTRRNDCTSASVEMVLTRQPSTPAWIAETMASGSLVPLSTTRRASGNFERSSPTASGRLGKIPRSHSTRRTAESAPARVDVSLGLLHSPTMRRSPLSSRSFSPSRDSRSGSIRTVGTVDIGSPQAWCPSQPPRWPAQWVKGSRWNRAHAPSAFSDYGRRSRWAGSVAGRSAIAEIPGVAGDEASRRSQARISGADP